MARCNLITCLSQSFAGFEPDRAFPPNPALQLKLSLKKTAKGTICPLQNLEKKAGKEAHTKRFISKQKLQAKTEHGKFQSRSTEHVRLMLNQAW